MSKHGILASQRKSEHGSGFTIVELLIVIVVIGILAAIVLNAQASVRNQAIDNSVKSDMVNFAKSVESQRAVTGSYPTVLTANMGIRFTKASYLTNRNNLYYCVNPTTDKFALAAQATTGNSWRYIAGEGVSSTPSPTSANTCALISQAGNSNYAGYDNGTGNWQAWVND
ncbi:prepilin-type N-terminal cleavage/methylation domain-containing protein [Candidatus Saccharibacteria bacterium]|nr:prepilin-type N-terminal cleavage/methylation domain-containing protein [Candidatus Saccharibacteria bacterium]